MGLFSRDDDFMTPPKTVESKTTVEAVEDDDDDTILLSTYKITLVIGNELKEVLVRGTSILVDRESNLTITIDEDAVEDTSNYDLKIRTFNMDFVLSWQKIGTESVSRSEYEAFRELGYDDENDD